MTVHNDVQQTAKHGGRDGTGGEELMAMMRRGQGTDDDNATGGKELTATMRHGAGNQQ